MFRVMFTPNSETLAHMEDMELGYYINGEVVYKRRGPIKPYTTETERGFKTREEADEFITQCIQNGDRTQYSIEEYEDKYE